MKVKEKHQRSKYHIGQKVLFKYGVFHTVGLVVAVLDMNKLVSLGLDYPSQLYLLYITHPPESEATDIGGVSMAGENEFITVAAAFIYTNI
jgi:hypothetical protein